MEGSGTPRRRSPATALLIAVLLCAGLVLWLRADVEGPHTSAGTPAPVDLRGLVAATTRTEVRAAPPDRARERVPSGQIVHPRRTVPVYDRPGNGGSAVAKLTPDQFGDTWVPVVGRRPGWVRVLLPSRPNGSTGWLRTDRLDHARTSSLVRVHLARRTLELYDDGSLVGSWPVAVGAPATPTPTGRTFVLGQLTDPQQSYSPVIIPLGTHSESLDTYGGGPGTVALHGWTDPSVFGRAVSHGCVRVPADALDALRNVPLGTPVLIDAD
ncbi:L,D-transpeptidase [Nocardioides stalactiti]|uniref:L,D-transpeptidase n=1 Tax=Nocardioides stalactiti TaxID=2755356 RepID=UPI001601319B|nr:L,D-transpeptidase [Nocardioides stalactiti]